MTPRPIDPTIRAGGEGAGEDAVLKAALREALSLWPGGVAVVAVRDDDEVLALTVNAFASVSQSPPLVLACIGEHAGILPSLLDAGRFTVTLLAEGQKRLAAAFADKLPPPDADFGPDGDPVLRGAVASLVCSVWETYPGGDHRIVVGLVERVEIGSEEAPLVYHRRRYRGIGGG
jgi:flavin reductase (NADH)